MGHVEGLNRTSGRNSHLPVENIQPVLIVLRLQVVGDELSTVFTHFNSAPFHSETWIQRSSRSKSLALPLTCCWGFTSLVGV